jgi:hypothetical protein
VSVLPKQILLEKRHQNLMRNLSARPGESFGPVSKIPRIQVGLSEVPSGSRRTPTALPWRRPFCRKLPIDLLMQIILLMLDNHPFG